MYPLPQNQEDFIIKKCDIPPMPNVAHRILEMMNDPDVTNIKLQEAIMADQALTVQILKIANSPFYGIPRIIRNLSTAIMILGYKMIRNIVIASIVKSLDKKTGLTEAMLWEHSIGASIASFLLAKEIKFPDPEEAFLSGLLHDIGKQIMNNSDPGRYMNVIEMVYNENVTFYFAEKEIFGFTHPEVGAIVIRKWKLSEELEQAIYYHHDGYIDFFKKHPFYIGKLAIIVNLADLICLKLGIGCKEPYSNLNIEESDSAYLLKLSEDRLSDIIDKVLYNFEKEKELFKY